MLTLRKFRDLTRLMRDDAVMLVGRQDVQLVTTLPDGEINLCDIVDALGDEDEVIYSSSCVAKA